MNPDKIDLMLDLEFVILKSRILSKIKILFNYGFIA